MKKKVLAKALNLIGILLMITVILIMVPLTVPKLFGVRIYGVLTGSMTPAYSVGGVVYVVDTEPEEIQVGDVITYQLGTNTEYVMTHRVVEMEDGFFITKGDANNAVDPEPVSYERLIGKVAFFIPGLSGVAEFVNSSTGRSVFIMLFAAAFILWVVADLIYPSAQKKKSGIKEHVQSTSAAEEKKVKSGKKHKHRGYVIQLIGAALMIGALVYLADILLGYQESSKEYDSLEQEVFADIDVSESEFQETSAEDSAQNKQLTEEDKKILQGIAGLHEENQDVIGWILFDNMDISYPIMQGEDNEYYLKHTFSGEENSAGSIFMEASNSPDFEDSHTIVYGHNMKNQSMFGSLKKFKTQDYYEENKYFSIYTLDTVYRYQIFAYYDISMYGDVYNNQFGADDYFQMFIDTMVSRSYYDTGVKPVKTDKIVTLSTCSTKGNRFVVNAVRIQ